MNVNMQSASSAGHVHASHAVSSGHATGGATRQPAMRSPQDDTAGSGGDAAGTKSGADQGDMMSKVMDALKNLLQGIGELVGGITSTAANIAGGIASMAARFIKP